MDLHYPGCLAIPSTGMTVTRRPCQWLQSASFRGIISGLSGLRGLLLFLLFLVAISCCCSVEFPLNFCWISVGFPLDFFSISKGKAACQGTLARWFSSLLFKLEILSQPTFRTHFFRRSTALISH